MNTQIKNRNIIYKNLILLEKQKNNLPFEYCYIKSTILYTVQCTFNINTEVDIN